jgi:predicted transcriptional regulator
MARSTEKDGALQKVPPRERELLDLLYRHGDSTVAELGAALAKPLSASALRTMLSRLEAKGMVARRQSDGGWVYSVALPRERARASLLRYLVNTFFGGSAARAATALLDTQQISELEVAELEQVIARARRQGKRR